MDVQVISERAVPVVGLRAQVVPGPHAGTVVVAIDAPGGWVALSVQPDGSFQTRPNTAIGPWETATRDGNLLVYHVDGMTYAVPIVQEGADVPEPIDPPPPPETNGWMRCGATSGVDLVACIHADVQPAHTPEGAFEVTKRVAWLLRASGAGLLIKRGGDNTVTWHGESFSAGRICYPDGRLVKVLTDIPTTNGPSWQDNGVVAVELYVPAIEPWAGETVSRTHPTQRHVDTFERASRCQQVGS
jgi:hypothetical protein